MDNFLPTVGGLKNYSVFGETSSFVDRSKPPGHSSQPQSWSSWLYSTLTLNFFIHSPNLVWFLVTVAVYQLFPYKYDMCKDLQSKSAQLFFLQRLLLHISIVGSYYTFWFVSLYCSRCAKRKFRGVPEEPLSDSVLNSSTTYLAQPDFPSSQSMLHNIWYWTLGIVQWAGWETVYVHLFATSKIDQGSGSLVVLGIGIVLVPIWRGFHFYVSHRFLHTRPMYQFVHKLHHRNIEIEPFAGLTMHPVEHLYYFICIAFPTLWFGGSPFLLLWNGYHLLLSPAASHSGWEDHFQGDQFHYLHHAKFECNYGSASMPFDYSSGTFTDKLKDSRGTTKKVAKKTTKKGVCATLDAVFLKGSQRSDVFYTIATCCIFFLLVNRLAGSGGWSTWLTGKQMGVLVGFGPVGVAVAARWWMGDSLSIRWPFHKEHPVKFGVHTLLGVALTCWPVYQTVVLLVV